MDNYQYLGIVFISFAIPFALYSYFILLNIPLSAFGLSTLILGITLLQVPSSPIPSKQIRAMTEASLINIEALLEEYDVSGKAVYFTKDGRVNAFIPIIGEVNTNFNPLNISLRVHTKIGNQEGIQIFTPGSELVRLAMIPEDTRLEDALNTVLVDFTELVEGLKAVEDNDQIIVELSKPKQDTEYDRVSKSLGSLGISVAGSVIATITNKPVFFEREEKETDKTTGYYRI